LAKFPRTRSMEASRLASRSATTIRSGNSAPSISGLKPYGLSITTKRSESVFLLYEEYEAIRLCDYEKYNQTDAATFMEISRPTLTRIYTSAREKIATAMIEGRRIIIEGGKVSLDNDWFHCKTCDCYFNRIKEEDSIDSCSLCGSSDIEPFNSDSTFINQAENHPPAHSCCGRGKCQGTRQRRKCCETKE